MILRIRGFKVMLKDLELLVEVCQRNSTSNRNLILFNKNFVNL